MVTFNNTLLQEPPPSVGAGTSGVDPGPALPSSPLTAAHPTSPSTADPTVARGAVYPSAVRTEY